MLINFGNFILKKKTRMLILGNNVRVIFETLMEISPGGKMIL